MIGDRSKLPKWAQNQFQGLERQVRKLEQQVLRLEAERDGALPCQKPLAVRDAYSEKPVPVAWNRYDSIRFFLGAGHRERVDINVHDGELHVMAGGPLSVTPQASNTVLIRVQQRV